MFFSIESEMGCGRAIRLALEKLGGAYRGPGDSNEGNCQTCGNMPAQDVECRMLRTCINIRRASFCLNNADVCERVFCVDCIYQFIKMSLQCYKVHITDQQVWLWNLVLQSAFPSAVLAYFCCLLMEEHLIQGLANYTLQVRSCRGPFLVQPMSEECVLHFSRVVKGRNMAETVLACTA